MKNYYENLSVSRPIFIHIFSFLYHGVGIRSQHQVCVFVFDNLGARLFPSAITKRLTQRMAHSALITCLHGFRR